MIYFYMYFIFFFIFIYVIHRGEVEDYSYLKPYREITLRELASIRYVEHRIRFSMEDMFSWFFYRVKKKKVYRFENITKASLKKVSSYAKRHSNYVFSFEHQNLEHELRISSLMYDYLRYKIYDGSIVAVEFTKEAIGEWHVLNVELEKREVSWKDDSPIIKEKIDYIELYKLMHLRKNNIDSSFIATKVRRASKKERREFEFYPLGSIMLWTALFVFLMDFSVNLRRANFSEFFLVPMSLIALLYIFYFYNKRVWYWRNSKVYTIKGELCFDYNIYAYTLNRKELHLSRAWENFLNKHTQRSQSYFVEMDVLINKYEGGSFLSAYQPIRLKVLNSQIDYKKLPTRKHPLFLIVLVVSLYYILFGFDYQELLKKSFYGIRNIYEKEQGEFFPYKEVTIRAYPIPILDKHYQVLAYTLIDNNKTIQEAYRPFKKIEKSFAFHKYYIEMEKDYENIGYALFKLRMLQTYSLEKSELNSKFISLLKEKYKLLEKLQVIKYKTYYGKEKETYRKLNQSLLELNFTLSSLYDKVLQNDISEIKEKLDTFSNILKRLYNLSDIYIKSRDTIYNYRACHDTKECYDELLKLYKVYNRIIVPPKLENIKGKVNSYFYITHHIKLIETDSNYNKDMNNIIVATAIWVLSVLFFVTLLIVTLYQSILYIWGLSYYLFTYNRVDEVLKKSLEKVATPSLSIPKEKQFVLTLKMIVIMILSFLGIIFLLSYNPNGTRVGTSFYAKRRYEEEIRHKKWLKRIKEEENQLLNVLKNISKQRGSIHF